MMWGKELSVEVVQFVICLCVVIRQTTEYLNIAQTRIGTTHAKIEFLESDNESDAKE